MIDAIKNLTINRNRYRTHSEAIIISCYFNPEKSPYRLKAFNEFYGRIKHMNHRIIECVIGNSSPDLPENENIERVYTQNLLWHKEALLNSLIALLPEKYKYVFWIDADVIFTNLDWLVEGVEQLKTKTIIQPFEYCVHLDRDQLEPSFSMKKLTIDILKGLVPNQYNSKVWRSFSANYNSGTSLWKDSNYNRHGHVGFAWGSRRELLQATYLFDKALIGGADHIMAHAAAGQIDHVCIEKSFKDDIESVKEWMEMFHFIMAGEIGYVKGNLYHIWHGDIEKRQYLKRIQDFTQTAKKITTRDKNGLFTTEGDDDEYVKKYFKHREVTTPVDDTISNVIMMENLLHQTHSHDHHKPEEGGGGSFGGGGASGSWNEDNHDTHHHENHHHDNSNNDTFS